MKSIQKRLILEAILFAVAQQHKQEKAELLAKATFLQNSLIMGAVPVAVGLLLVWL